MIRDVVLKASTLDEAKDLLERRNALCGHYFRILYQLLKFIATNIPNGAIGQEFTIEALEQAPLSKSEKMYSNIARSFISYDVSQVLAINCYCSGKESTYWRYKQLLDRYEFLEHMPFEVAGQQSSLLKLTIGYYDRAFGDSGFVKNLGS